MDTMNPETASRVDHTNGESATRTEHMDAESVPRPEQTNAAEVSRPEQLFSDDDRGGYRSRWESIQGQFVDSPRESVEQADQLVEEVTQRLTELFSQERSGLEEQWSRGDGQASTEDLRMALTRYRSFFDRLLAA